MKNSLFTGAHLHKQQKAFLGNTSARYIHMIYDSLKKLKNFHRVVVFPLGSLNLVMSTINYVVCLYDSYKETFFARFLK